MKTVMGASLVAVFVVLLFPLAAEGGCYGCDQQAKCQTREAGTLGFTSCSAYTLNGNSFCELSGSQCTGGSGGGCCKEKDVMNSTSPQWQLASVTTWAPEVGDQWVLVAATTSDSEDK